MSPNSIAVLPDGSVVVASSEGADGTSGGIATFKRNAAAPSGVPFAVSFENFQELMITTGGNDDEVYLDDVGATTTTLNTGAGDDFVHVLRTGTGSNTEINGETGNDTFRIDGAAMIGLGPVTIDGGEPDAGDPDDNDTLIFNPWYYGVNLSPGNPASDPSVLQSINLTDGGNQVEPTHSFVNVENLTILDPAEVVARHIFYNNSYFDGNDPAANSGDDGAIAPGKTALLPGQKGRFANYTSYSKGINGIMVDINGLAGTPQTSDFEFRVGNNSNPAGWTTEPPAPAEIVVREDAGINGSDRITLSWADGAIQDQWLMVTVLATANTGLAQPDVFFFGNAPGECGNNTSEPTPDAIVNLGDVILTRNNQTGFGTADIENSFDYNRDQRVNLSDVIFCRNNQSGFTPLNLIDLSGFSATVAAPQVEFSVATELAASLVAADIENSFDQSRDERGNLGDVILCRNNQSDFSPLNLIDLSSLSATVAAQRVESSLAEEWAAERAPAVESALLELARLESSAFYTKPDKQRGVTESTSVSAHDLAFGEIIEEESEPLSSCETDTTLAHDLAAMMALRTQTSAKTASRDRAVDNILAEYMYYE